MRPPVEIHTSTFYSAKPNRVIRAKRLSLFFSKPASSGHQRHPLSQITDVIITYEMTLKFASSVIPRHAVISPQVPRSRRSALWRENSAERIASLRSSFNSKCQRARPIRTITVSRFRLSYQASKVCQMAVQIRLLSLHLLRLSIRPSRISILCILQSQEQIRRLLFLPNARASRC